MEMLACVWFCRVRKIILLDVDICILEGATHLIGTYTIQRTSSNIRFCTLKLTRPLIHLDGDENRGLVNIFKGQSAKALRFGPRTH